MLLMNVIIFYTELDLVLLPPDNVDGDTDKEVGNGTELTDINFDQIQEVSRMWNFPQQEKQQEVRKRKQKITNCQKTTNKK